MKTRLSVKTRLSNSQLAHIVRDLARAGNLPDAEFFSVKAESDFARGGDRVSITLSDAPGNVLWSWHPSVMQVEHLRNSYPEDVQIWLKDQFKDVFVKAVDEAKMRRRNHLNSLRDLGEALIDISQQILKVGALLTQELDNE